MNLKTLLLAFLALHWESSAQAVDVEPVDSLCLSDSMYYDMLSARNLRHEKFFLRRGVQCTYVGLPLIVGGVMQIHHNKMFRYMRNNVVPKFHTTVDDYLQYVPAAAMLGMKLAGVKGRSSWGKMLVADAFSAALMAATVNTMKYTVRLQRPDGSNRNSFPSGHTATAFLTATLMHKEYGDRYPWISISSYVLAAGVGGMRMLNNRHWMSDVLAGAGIGIIAGEFGYWFSDLIFPHTPRSYSRSAFSLYDEDSPWFISVGAGTHVPLRRTISLDDGRLWKLHSGGYVSLDGAWFWNKNFGIGAQLCQGNSLYYQVSGDGSTDVSRNAALLAGIYFRQPFFHRLSVMGRAMVGGARYFKNPRMLSDSNVHGGVASFVGAGLMLRANEHFQYAFTIDYMVLQSPLKEMRVAQSLRIGANFGYQF